MTSDFETKAREIIQELTGGVIFRLYEQKALTALCELHEAGVKGARIEELNNVLKMPVTTVEYDDIGTQACVRTGLVLKRLAELSAQSKEKSRHE